MLFGLTLSLSLAKYSGPFAHCKKSKVKKIALHYFQQKTVIVLQNHNYQHIFLGFYYKPCQVILLVCITTSTFEPFNKVYTLKSHMCDCLNVQLLSRK